MLRNCPHCGAANRERANDCYVCEAPLPEMSAVEPEPFEPLDSSAVARDLERDILGHIPEPERVAAEPAARAATITEFRAPAQPASRAATALEVNSLLTAAPAATRAGALLAPDAPPHIEPEWKREVASKLEEYRSRRQRTADDPQTDLPFAPHSEASQPAEHPRASLRYAARARRQEGVEIAAQPNLDFDARQEQQNHSFAPPASARLVPVANLRNRLHAGLLDAGFLTIAYGGFLLMFHWLGSAPLNFGKVDALVYAATAFLIYAQYFALFTIFGAATPGMSLRGLHVVSFDGAPPTARQMIWRTFGYLVSGAAALLGFAWALWDEDQLTWQDRISQTYLTTVPSHSFPASSASYPDPSSFDSPAQSWKLS